MANPELGAKQICPTCSSKFYDLGRRPAVCPKCGETFDPEEALRNRRVRARTSTPDYEDEPEKEVKTPDPDADGFEEEPDQTPEIDDEAAVEPIETD
ncbi:MAG: TIGR02300 family protein, partial [Caulobacter sp.]